MEWETVGHRRDGGQGDKKAGEGADQGCGSRQQHKRMVTFAHGPLGDIYGTEDGHPDAEGRTARPTDTLSSGAPRPPFVSSAISAFTVANLETLRVMLGPDCAPSLERLERRLAASTTASSSGSGRAGVSAARAARAAATPDAKDAPHSFRPPFPLKKRNRGSSPQASAQSEMRGNIRGEVGHSPGQGFSVTSRLLRKKQSMHDMPQEQQRQEKPKRMEENGDGGVPGPVRSNNAENRYLHVLMPR
jgi:hypothetical protein